MIKKQLKLHQRTCVAVAMEETLGTFCYPTGTGKTLAEAAIIVEHIKEDPTGIFVVLVPRIMLAQQLFSEIWTEVVLAAGIKCSFFSLHSGASPKIKQMTKKLRLVNAEELDDQDDNEDALAVLKGLRSLNLSDEQIAEEFPSGTTRAKLLKATERAAELGQPLVIVSTYHSSDMVRIAFDESDFNVKVMIADEGHNAVAIGFQHVHDMPADKRFYFTATLKNTDGGEDGCGMQNQERFGPILDKLSPKEAVARGLIVGPRVHYVEIAGVNDENVIDADFKAIEAAFVAHAKMTNGIGAKLLVAARGTKEIKQIMEHGEFFKRLRTIRPNLKVFDVTSVYGARINGVSVDRSTFLLKLQELQNHEEAIILHYDILSEGIDVPGITGVMPLRNLGVSKFLQTLGRATRLHATDRARLADETTAEAEAAKLDWFTKQCAWLVLPCYGNFGGEIKASAETYVRQLRTFGWIPGENDLLTEAGGENEPKPIDEVHPDGKNLPAMVEMMEEINQRFESMEEFTSCKGISNKKTAWELL
jgi:superfamily II DNA or RNA helicase